MDLTDGFIDLLASTNRIARHLHAPLQSGSNRILRCMHRWYTREEYAERIEKVARVWGNAGIGADVIVGFPGETDEDFRETCELVERLPFSYLHVFSYSDRPGTEGASLGDKVPKPVIWERSKILRQLAADKGEQFRQRQIGKQLRALTLTAREEDGSRHALSENYLKLRVHGPETSLQPNQLLSVSVDSVDGNFLRASA
jgi:threonylcarbamoyladenosine tRNA methylthiotransferase MtaB